MSERPQLSIVLPCYNEARNLPPLLERYREAWPDFAAELILVENGSTDDSAEVLAGLLESSRYPFVRTVTVPKNRGYGYGIAKGLQATRGTFVAFSHADMQCAPQDVFAAYRRLREQPAPEKALVKGRRIGRALPDRVFTGVMSMMASLLLATPLTDINAQPKVFHRSLLTRLSNPPDGLQLDLYVLYQARRAGWPILTIPVQFPPRLHGTSSWAHSFASKRRNIELMIAYMFRLGFGAGN
jgi:glycosyltransferase involved in cell wall biosynthesis